VSHLLIVWPFNVKKNRSKTPLLLLSSLSKKIMILIMECGRFPAGKR